MTDADVDGTGSIYPSLLAYFTQWPQLFAEGRVRFVKTPVIIAQVGKKQEWFYDLPSYDAAKESLGKHSIRYIKGLGSLTRDEYERVIQEPVYDVVRLPENWKDLFEMLMGNEVGPRRKFIEDNAQYVENLDA